LKENVNIIRDLDPQEAKELLDHGAQRLGISLTSHQLDQFLDYLFLLQKWNRLFNLTGLRSCREIIIKHFLDSLTVLPYLPEEARILDLGSGAGFPGLPIQICRLDQSITLIEASNKKCNFLKEVVRHLNLRNTHVVQGYLGKESLSLLGSIQFDIIISRAVGRLKEFLNGVYRYLVPGGKFVLMKGRQGLQEIADLEVEIKKNGFQIETPIFLNLPILDQERIVIFLTKHSNP
jgi:16S rRNA (guanine527-N7)-methyltransferase